MFNTPRIAAPAPMCAFTAYTPNAGRHSTSLRRFAVGKPMVRPRASPWTTVPLNRCGRPSNAAAPTTSPAAINLRIRELEIGSSPSIIGETCSTTTAGSAARKASTSPPRPEPKRKSQPTTTALACNREESTVEANSAADCAANARVNGSTTTPSTPSSSSSANLRARVISRGWCRSGASTAVGGGSKVYTHVGSPASAAKLESRERT